MKKTASRCPECGAALAPDAPRGFCPKCLMKAGMESQDQSTDPRATAPLSTQDVWEFPEDDRPVEALLLLAEVLAAHRIDETGSLVALQVDALKKAWEELQVGR